MLRTALFSLGINPQAKSLSHLKVTDPHTRQLKDWHEN